MFGSTILEVAIGLVLVYLLLSLTASAINEGIARFLALRANTLQAGIQTLLDDPNNKELMNAFYSHPLLQTLARDGRFDQLIRRESKPSYIPANYFRLILLDLPRYMGLLPQTQTDATVGGATSGDTGTSTEVLPTADLENTISYLPNGQLKESLLLIVRDAGGTLKDAETAIEQWFDNSMEHVTGWYKRKVELIILAIGIVLSVVLNIDTIAIVTALMNDSALRAAAVAVAEQKVTQGILTPTSTITATVDISPTNALSTTAPSTNTISANVIQLETDLQSIGLPIGWNDNDWKDSEGRILSFDHWLSKISGLLLSGIAVSMGAPFWFDLLNKIVNVRATGKKPEDEPKK